jgi:hypothetical protein
MSKWLSLSLSNEDLRQMVKDARYDLQLEKANHKRTKNKCRRLDAENGKLRIKIINLKAKMR